MFDRPCRVIQDSKIHGALWATVLRLPQSIEFDAEVAILDISQPFSLSHIKPVAPEFLDGDKIQAGHPLFGIIWINRKRVSGAPCFFGTRVPVKTLFDCLAAGETLEQFLDDFEGVDREQALAVLDLASRDLLSDLESL